MRSQPHPTPSLRRLVSVAALSSALVGSALATVNVYVSPTGKDTNLGKSPATAVATLSKARDVVLNLRKYTTTEDAVIWMAPGAYAQSATLYFDNYSNNLSIRSTDPSSPARLIGGIALKGGSAVGDAALRSRIPAAWRDRAVQYSLNALGANVGTLKRRSGHDFQWLSSAMELSFDGAAGRLAKYPNEGWMTVTPLAGQTGSGATTFGYSDAQASVSASDKNAVARGFFGNMFNDSIHPLAALNPGSRTATMAPGQGSYYGFSANGRWRIENSLAELDTPGEYYLDAASNSVIALAPDGTREILASTLENSIFKLNNASNIKFQDLSFESGRVSGVVINSGDYNLIDGCTFKNFGVDGVDIMGGRGNGVTDSTFLNMGECGVFVQGGDRISLTPAGNYVEDSTFKNWGRGLLGYRPAVRLAGVGNRVSRCTMSDSTAQGVTIAGNNNLVEKCDIGRVVKELGDSGAIYIGFNFTERGNVIRDNMIHEVYSPKGLPTRWDENFGIYLDDMASGTTVTGNVVTDCSAGLIVGGGRNNTVAKNVFHDVEREVLVDGRGKTFKADYYKSGGRFWQNANEVNAFGPVYTAAYPELKRLLNEDYAAPAYNDISNSTAKTGWVYYYDKFASASGYALRNNLVGYDPRFVNPDAYDFRLRPGSPAQGLGLTQLTKSSVGATVKAMDPGMLQP